MPSLHSRCKILIKVSETLWKNKYQSFLILSIFASLFYFVPLIFSDIVFLTTFTACYHLPPTFITLHQILSTFILLLPIFCHPPLDFTTNFSPTFSNTLLAPPTFVLLKFLLKIVVDKIYLHL